MADTHRPRRAGDADFAALSEYPHRRYDPLRDDWVLVSPGRTRRPWLGHRETPPAESLPGYDPDCYLCPGNTRANGERNPEYSETFVFTNDYPALTPVAPTSTAASGLLLATVEAGTCRVVCFSPRHDLTIATMPPEGVRKVVDVWAGQTAELGETYAWVQVFENRGEAMGASNPHPHGQIWAGTAIPREGTREDACQERYAGEHGRPLLIDYAEQERSGPRVVVDDEEWQIVVPFWAVWPFETMVIPRRPVRRLPELDDRQRDRLARSLVDLLVRYDALFEAPFPYSMGWHQAPFDGREHASWQLHAHFYPPLLRSVSVRKFMVGYEMLAEPQRDLTAEDAAERLRSALPSIASPASPSPPASPSEGPDYGTLDTSSSAADA